MLRALVVVGRVFRFRSYFNAISTIKFITTI